MNNITRKELEKMLEGATNGPWSQSHRELRDGDYSTQAYNVDGDTIATIAWFPVQDGSTIRTSRAENAKLIASAPQMAKQLIELMEENADLLNALDSIVDPHRDA